MSMWTYVNGVIEVNTMCSSTAKSLYVVQTVIDHLPRITGSEGCVNLYVVVPNGHSLSSSCDEFLEETNLADKKYYDTRRRKMFESQTKALIVVNGNLRDRYFPFTLKETTKMLNRLSSRLCVEKCLVNVTDYWQSYTFNNPTWIYENHWNIEHDWVKEKMFNNYNND